MTALRENYARLAKALFLQPCACIRSLRLPGLARGGGWLPKAGPKWTLEISLERVSVGFVRRVPGGIRRKTTGDFLKPDLIALSAGRRREIDYGP